MAQKAAHRLRTVRRYARASLLIWASMLLMFAENIGGVDNAAQDAILPHKDLAKRVAARETATESERGHYTYRQSVSINDYSGEYRESRDIIFSPSGERTEVVLGKPSNNLRRLLLTEEDFRDIREVQPMLLTRDTLWLYDSRFRGEESDNGID